MIDRINLIEKEPFRFSYTRMIKSAVAFCILLGLVYSSLFVRTRLHNKNIDHLQIEIQALQEEYKKLLKKSPPKIGDGPLADLKNIILTSPEWANILRDLASRLPANVWLTEFSFQLRDPSPPKEKDKEEKEAKDSKKQAAPPVKKPMTLQGRAMSLGELSSFLERLKESPYINRATLTASKREENTFSFTIECDMTTGFQDLRLGSVKDEKGEATP